MSTNPRPYFVPASLDYDALPLAIKVAVDEIIQPAYEELVLQASTALERAAGASFVCLLFLELLEQFDVGEQIGERMAQSAEGGALPREAELSRYLRLLGAKHKAGGFLLRVRSLNAQRDPFAKNFPTAQEE